MFLKSITGRDTWNRINKRRIRTKRLSIAKVFGKLLENSPDSPKINLRKYPERRSLFLWCQWPPWFKLKNTQTKNRWKLTHLWHNEMLQYTCKPTECGNMNTKLWRLYSTILRTWSIYSLTSGSVKIPNTILGAQFKYENKMLLNQSEEAPMIYNEWCIWALFWISLFLVGNN